MNTFGETVTKVRATLSNAPKAEGGGGYAYSRTPAVYEVYACQYERTLSSAMVVFWWLSMGSPLLSLTDDSASGSTTDLVALG